MKESSNTSTAASRAPESGLGTASLRCPACDRAISETHPVPRLSVPDREYGLARIVEFATCTHCRSCFQVPMPSEAELGTLYPPDYHSMTSDSALGRIRHRMRLARLLRLAPEARTLLDYGCGSGGFLQAAAALEPRRRFFGYEIGPADEVRDLAAGRVTLFRGSSEFLFAQLPEVDLVTMNHVIEHLPEPTAILARLAERLSAGGVLEGQTPAAGSLEQRVFGTRWSGYHAPRHTVVFSQEGLRALLSRTGFGEIELTPAFNPAGLAVSVSSLLQGASGGVIRRSGLGWIVSLVAGGLLSPIDLLCGSPGIIDFAVRPGARIST